MTTIFAAPELCEICSGGDFELLHRQDFILPGEIRTHYDVTCCRGCGFTVARNTPSAAEYDAYYKANTRYTLEGSRNVSPALAKIHGDNFAFVNRYLAAHVSDHRAARVLDVGCATGHLLSFFYKAGYKEVLGVDPAPECRAIGERLYGVRIETAAISAFAPEQPFDVVTLASVLEHFPNAYGALQRIATWLPEDGMVFVQVPDAETFGIDMKEPFLEFSVEHVKYFTRTSLERLMSRVGFSLAALQKDVLNINGTSYPAITALFRKRPAPTGWRTKRSDVEPLRAYIARSKDKLASVERAIAALVQSQEPVVIWGVGSLTARLMATTAMGRMNIVGFVDSASGLHGQQLHGRQIRPPAWLASQTATVFVSSYVWAEPIRQTLVNDLAYSGKIVTL